MFSQGSQIFHVHKFLLYKIRYNPINSHVYQTDSHHLCSYLMQQNFAVRL